MGQVHRSVGVAAQGEAPQHPGGIHQAGVLGYLACGTVGADYHIGADIRAAGQAHAIGAHVAVMESLTRPCTGRAPAATAASKSSASNFSRGTASAWSA